MARQNIKRWSRRVTEESNAMDLEAGVFTRTDPRSIARSLKRSAEQSRREKAIHFVRRCRCSISISIAQGKIFRRRTGTVLKQRRKNCGIYTTESGKPHESESN